MIELEIPVSATSISQEKNMLINALEIKNRRFLLSKKRSNFLFTAKLCFLLMLLSFTENAHAQFSEKELLGIIEFVYRGNSPKPDSEALGNSLKIKGLPLVEEIGSDSSKVLFLYKAPNAAKAVRLVSNTIPPADTSVRYQTPA